MDEQQPIRVVVEVVSSSDVQRLEGRDEDLRAEIVKLNRRIEGLHRVLYEAIEAMSGKRNKG